MLNSPVYPGGRGAGVSIEWCINCCSKHSNCWKLIRVQHSTEAIQLVRDHVISSAIWNKWARLTKLNEPVGRVQFGVCEKFTSAYLFQIAQEKSFDYLIIIYMKNVRDGWAEGTHAYHAIKETKQMSITIDMSIRKKQRQQNIQRFFNVTTSADFSDI